MATELISSGAGQSAVFDFTVTAGTPRTLHIHFTGASGRIAYRLFQKSSASAYQLIDTLTPQNIVDKGTFTGAGVFGISRVAGANASSLEID